MKPNEALDELIEYVQKVQEFCISKNFHKDTYAKYHFLMTHMPHGSIITSEVLKKLESSHDFWEFLIFEEKFSGKSPIELFVQENKHLTEDIKTALLNLKSIYSLFIVEKIDKEREEIVIREAYSNERYTVWTRMLLDKVKVGEAIRMRLVKWRNFFFGFGIAEVIDMETTKKIILHENFLAELEKDIESFLSRERSAVSRKTYRKRKNHLYFFYDFISEHIKVNSYTKFNDKLVIKYIKWSRRFINISDSFIKESITSLRKFFNYLIEKRKLSENPAKNIHVV